MYPGKILLIDDDKDLNKLVVRFLTDNGFTVAVETNGERAVERIIQEQPKLAILDVMLPDLDGLSVCRRVRVAGYHGPILMLTALGDDIDEVAGLETGVDDYLVKPIRPRVLLARIRALLRRVNTEASSSTANASDQQRNSLQIDDLTISASARSVHINNRLIELTGAEFDLLWLLACHAGQILSRDDIHNQLRGLEFDGLDRTIDLRISRIRKKLGDDPKNPTRIKSVRGAGYLLSR